MYDWLYVYSTGAALCPPVYGHTVLLARAYSSEDEGRTKLAGPLPSVLSHGESTVVSAGG
eukprot:COSAG01_NODE_3030_length_6698_cov_13.145022_3_plen_60_part_00